jgi:hypothetical protein
MKIILLFLLMIQTIAVFGQSSFGSASFAKPTIGEINFPYVTETSVQVEVPVIDNGGAVINKWVIFLDNNSATDTLIWSPLNNVLYPQLPFYLWDYATGLTSGTTYYAKCCVYNIAGETCSGIYSITLPSTPVFSPSVTTNAATSVATTTATLNGNVTSDGGASVTDRGFYYSMTYPPATQVTSGSWTGTYTTSLTGLNIGQTYYYRAYATNSAGESLGDIVSFTLQYPDGNPHVETVQTSNITTNMAIAGGNVLYNGGSDITDRGVCYSTSSNTDINDPYSYTGGAMGDYSVYLINLTESTTYYYRAYARNSDDEIGYGAEYSFTTLSASSAPTVVTNSATSILAHGFTLNGNVTNQGSSAVTTRGFVYSLTDATPEIGETGVTNVTAGSGTGVYNSVVWSGSYIFCGTNHYARAYAINSQGTSYGDVITLTTASETFTYTGFFMTSLTQSGTTINITSYETALQVADSLGMNSSGRYYTSNTYRLIELANTNIIHDFTQCKEVYRDGWRTVINYGDTYPYADVMILLLTDGVISNLEWVYY